MTEAAEKKAFDKALKLLTFRDHSCQELRRKLRERGFEDVVIDIALQRLIENGYLDDGRHAARWAHHLACDRLYGNARIRASLLEKGIAGDLIEGAITAARTELSEAEGLDRLIQKRGMDIAGKETEAIAAERSARKLLLALARKGYPLELVYDRLKKMRINASCD